LIDPNAGRITRGNRTIELDSLRHLEIKQGFISLGTARHWETIDLEDWRDASGPLISGGALSPAATGLIEVLRDAIHSNREAAGDRPVDCGCPPFHFRTIVRIDRTAIIITLISVLLVLWEVYRIFPDQAESPVSLEGLLWFLGILFLGTAGFVIKRKCSWLHFDREGVTTGRILGTRFYPWNEIHEFRRQHGEVEVAGEGFRIPMSMEILRAGGTPLVLRRGRSAILSLPARLFIAWLSMQKRERAEPPLGLQPSERRRARWWIGGLVAVNAAVFFLEEPYASWDRFSENLIRLGARTQNWMEEPWRLVTSLFLHVSTLHLLFNMLMLAALGLWVGKIFGWTRAMVLYLLGGILGNLIAELLQEAGFGPNPQMALGSSTAIMGLLGAMLGAIYRRPESVPLAARIRFRWAIPLALFLTLGMGLFLRFLDNCAHLGGFLAGLMLVWIIPPRSPASGENREKRFSHHQNITGK